ncbi:helix-turn-helix transcriptional regulator [Domibacillus sp. DTU_2020_1001157_1_SI_ALB_TIR_016]|uniref:helix-turn-helix domain-containing protein n=1 Tax=Domibacillus sp. DTU_2020_1001157_1_SI_ALB_TIR_016 TaxID=3077789 RepID=UPI0028E8BE0E|nr:helix-turn-helix transcriptional regulator [Domibacillus sp. DTU_2020_1001157_1_SI_ALB_TIR_016]WNS78406.1 helix-turn-helix transcriptional regulator [Domibacillus sp. DTU_2020_1001157_1_SI_ALB_TIR_016]
MNLNRLMALRKDRNWSLQYVSDQLGMAKSTYAGYESGYRRPSLEAITAMADLFHTSVDYILGRVDKPGTHADPPNRQDEKTIDLNNLENCMLSVDGQALSEEEIRQFVAFIKAKRELEQPARSK